MRAHVWAAAFFRVAILAALICIAYQVRDLGIEQERTNVILWMQFGLMDDGEGYDFEAIKHVDHSTGDGLSATSFLLPR